MKINTIIEGRLSATSTGSAYLVSQDLEEDLYIYKKNINKALHNDTVKVKIIEGKEPGTIEGKVTEIVERFKTEFVGTIDIQEHFAFVRPDSKKMNFDFYLKKGTYPTIKQGEKVIVKMGKWKDSDKSPNGRIIKRLGMPGENDVEIFSIMHEYGFESEFPKNVEKESEAINFEISEDEIKKRKDFRNVLTFTIDPDTAKDFDDALSYRELDNGNVEVGVHIADVSHYVKEGSELDKEAYKRATSVYLVDRVIPMLPERLSNGVCSLNPHQDKLAFSAVFELDNNGAIIKEWFGRTVIHSNHRFTYEDAQSAIEQLDAGKERVFSDAEYATWKLDKLAKKIRARRSKDSITFNREEVKFKLDDESKPIGIYTKVSKDSNKLIEEFMLLANKRVGKFIADKNKTFIYRIHDVPNEEKLLELATFIKEFGYEINLSKDIKTELNNLLKQIEGTPEDNMISNLVIRCMSKAKYTVNNIGHYGLGFEHYTHFTSPIRRYPDVMAHRLLQRYLNEGSNTNPVEYEDKCKWCFDNEMNAVKAERDSIKFKQVEFLMDKIGEEYEAVITSVKDWGVYAEIIENKCEGMIPKEDLADLGLYIISEEHKIKGVGRRVIHLGDTIKIKVKGVSLMRKEIEYELIK
jgi:ribonuclease R